MSETPSSGSAKFVILGLGLLIVLAVALLLRGGDDAPSEEPVADAPASGIAVSPSDRAMSGETQPPPAGTNATPTPIVIPEGSGIGLPVAPPAPIAFGTSIGDEPLILPEIDWEALPENSGEEAFEATLEPLADWVAELDEEYSAELLGVDCSAPPCVVGMAFDGTSFGDDHTAKAGFQAGFAEELTRLRGTRPAMTMVTATPDGTTAVWMYELPEGGDAEDLHADLNESAKVRHDEWMKAWSASRAGR